MRPREEGLNENGEAPPPYEPPKSEAAVVVDERTGLPRDSTSGVAIPMRTLSRDGAGTHQPPDYHEVTRSDSGTVSNLPVSALAPPADAHVQSNTHQVPPLGRTTSRTND